jgi:hypothetical protein
VPFIIIPLVILLLLLALLLLFRKENIKVRVVDVKEFTRTKDKAKVWRYTCGYGEDKVIGTTNSTDVKAVEGDTVLVQPKDLAVGKDGEVGWSEAKVLKVVGEDPDTEEHIMKKARG